MPIGATQVEADLHGRASEIADELGVSHATAVERMRNDPAGAVRDARAAGVDFTVDDVERWCANEWAELSVPCVACGHQRAYHRDGLGRPPARGMPDADQCLGEPPYPAPCACRGFVLPSHGRGRVVQRTCKRCGAVSSGGVYCPTGCGRIS